VTLRFTERTVTLRPDAGTISLDVELREHGERATIVEGARIELLDSQRHRLSDGMTDKEGTVRFELDSHALTSLGSNQLIASFDGDAKHDPGTATVTVVRQVRVLLELQSTPTDVNPGDDVDVTVRALAGHAGVEQGALEVRRDRRTLTSVPIRSGVATFSVPTPSDARGELAFEAHYVSGAPHLVAGTPLVWTVRAEPPGWPSRLAVAALVVGAAVVVVSSWRRSRVAAAPLESAGVLEPGIHITADPSHAGHFRGRVLDAHDGVPVKGALVRVRRPALTGDGLMFETTTAGDGTFEFTLEGRTRELVLEVRGEDHLPESKPLPSGGRMTVALVTRRRALLQRFVFWARRRGSTRERRGEPTPAELRAGLVDRPSAANWAAEVERAAFGPDRLDVATDERLRNDEPL
jgi:hypothetical protein